jgi:hypothetical protein
LESEDRIPLLTFDDLLELQRTGELNWKHNVLHDLVNLGAWPSTGADDVPLPVVGPLPT